jgi:hypothetical protein
VEIHVRLFRPLKITMATGIPLWCWPKATYAHGRLRILATLNDKNTGTRSLIILGAKSRTQKSTSVALELRRGAPHFISQRDGPSSAAHRALLPRPL